MERSSGTYQGRLRISKRGSPRTRQWLYFAVLRLVQKCGVRPWYEAKKAHDEADARRAVVAVMRKLAVALYYVGVHNEEFQPRSVIWPDPPAPRQPGGAKVANQKEVESGADLRSRRLGNVASKDASG